MSRQRSSQRCRQRWQVEVAGRGASPTRPRARCGLCALRAADAYARAGALFERGLLLQDRGGHQRGVAREELRSGDQSHHQAKGQAWLGVGVGLGLGLGLELRLGLGLGAGPGSASGSTRKAVTLALTLTLTPEP